MKNRALFNILLALSLIGTAVHLFEPNFGLVFPMNTAETVGFNLGVLFWPLMLSALGYSEYRKNKKRKLAQTEEETK